MWVGSPRRHINGCAWWGNVELWFVLWKMICWRLTSRISFMSALSLVLSSAVGGTQSVCFRALLAIANLLLRGWWFCLRRVFRWLPYTVYLAGEYCPEAVLPSMLSGIAIELLTSLPFKQKTGPNGVAFILSVQTYPILVSMYLRKYTIKCIFWLL